MQVNCDLIYMGFLVMTHHSVNATQKTFQKLEYTRSSPTQPENLEYVQRINS